MNMPVYMLQSKYRLAVHQRWKDWRSQGQQLCTTSGQEEDAIKPELEKGGPRVL